MTGPTIAKGDPVFYRPIADDGDYEAVIIAVHDAGGMVDVECSFPGTAGTLALTNVPFGPARAGPRSCWPRPA